MSFQYLYQHIKKTDPKLFDTLDKIDSKLDANAIPVAFQEPITVAPIGGYGLTLVQSLVPGFVLRLPKVGWWSLNLSVGLLIDPNDTAQVVLLTRAANSVIVTDGMALPDSINTGLTVGAQALQVVCSKVWTFNNASENNIIQVQAYKTAGAGISAVLIPGSSLTAIYLGK